MNDHDTKPNLRRVELYNDGVQAPPRFLFWGMIGVFVLFVGGIFAGLYAFNNILTPGQQERVVGILPFMDALRERQPTPPGGVLPTAIPDETSNQAALDLLNLSLGDDEEDEPASTSTNSPEAVSSPTNTPTAQPTATSTMTPTPEQIGTTSETSTSGQTGAVVVQATQATRQVISTSERLFGIRHQQQTWNNCGPATITMALSYYGWQNDQAYAAQFLKPNREDKNVSPNEMVQFVNERTNVRALYRIGGNIELVRQLVANQFPIIIETGFTPEAYDWIGHYRFIVAYDDLQQIFYIYDSYLGKGDADQGVVESYRNLDIFWRHFNRTFIVIYTPDREAELQALMGDLWNEQKAAEIAFSVAQEEATANPSDGFAWFNMASALTRLERYQEASNAFDRARRHELPFRLLWYRFEAFQAYYETGRFEDVLSLAQSNLNQATELEESYYWRGRALMAQGQRQQAMAEFRRALSYNPNFQPARDALNAS